MISGIKKNIIIRALEIRKNQGEEPADILDCLLYTSRDGGKGKIPT